MTARTSDKRRWTVVVSENEVWQIEVDFVREALTLDNGATRVTLDETAFGPLNRELISGARLLGWALER